MGLLGTVAGLLNVFRAMSVIGTGGIGAISAGLAEALTPFAFALSIALPSFWAHAYLAGRVRRIVRELTILAEPPRKAPR